MNIFDLMDKKGYWSIYDLTIEDLKDLGECISNESIGTLMELVEILRDDALAERRNNQ